MLWRFFTRIHFIHAVFVSITDVFIWLFYVMILFVLYYVAVTMLSFLYYDSTYIKYAIFASVNGCKDNYG